MTGAITTEKEISPTKDELSPLFSTRQVYVGALLGGAISGGWLLFLNFRTVNYQAQQKMVVVVSLLLTVLLTIGAMWLPTDFPRSYLIAFLIAGIYAAWHYLKLEETFTKHRDSGGPQASWWKTIGISIAALPATIVLFLIVMWLVPILPVNHFKNGTNIIYYEGSATREDAESLVAFFYLTDVINENASWEMTLLFPEDDSHRVIIKLPYLIDIKGTPAQDEVKALAALLDELKYPDKDVEIYVQNIFGLTTFVARNE